MNKEVKKNCCYWSGMIAIILAGISAGIGIGKIFCKCCEGFLIGLGISLFIIGIFALKNYVRLDKADKEVEWYDRLKKDKAIK
jgi:hypothetical protein